MAISVERRLLKPIVTILVVPVAFIDLSGFFIGHFTVVYYLRLVRDHLLESFPATEVSF